MAIRQVAIGGGVLGAEKVISVCFTIPLRCAPPTFFSVRRPVLALSCEIGHGEGRRSRARQAIRVNGGHKKGMRREAGHGCGEVRQGQKLDAFREESRARHSGEDGRPRNPTFPVQTVLRIANLCRRRIASCIARSSAARGRCVFHPVRSTRSSRKCWVCTRTLACTLQQ